MFSSLRDIAQIVWCHRRKALAVFACLILATWVALAGWPRTYRSEAVLLMRVGRESVALDPSATISQTLMLQKTQDDEVNSALNILSSYQVAAEAVDAIGAERILGSEPAAEDGRQEGPSWAAAGIDWVRGAIDAALWTARLKDPVGNRELAIERLQRSVAAFSAKNSTVITIHGMAKSPALAQSIVDEVTGAFLSQRLASSTTVGSREFFDDKVAALARDLEAKSQQLADFRQEHEIISIEASRTVLKEQLSRVEQELSTTEASLRQAASKAGDLQDKIADIAPEIIQARTVAADSTWSGMRQALYELQIQEKRLSQVVTADHPELVAIHEQVKQVEEILAGQTQESVGQTTAPNPVHTDLVKQLMAVQTSLVGYESQLESLTQQREALQQRLHQLVTDEMTLSRLEREFDLLDSDFRRHANKRQEAQVIEQLEAEHISNVNVIQPATFAEKPISPRKKIVAVAGLLASVAGAIVVALSAEAARATLRTSEHAEAKLGVPVLVTIPESKRIGNVQDCLAWNEEYAELKTGCRSLLRQLFAGYDRKASPPQTIGVLSCSAGAGGTTMATLLSMTATRDFGLRAVLVDADDHQTDDPPPAARKQRKWRKPPASDAETPADAEHPAASNASSAESPRRPLVESRPSVVGAHYANPQQIYDEVRRLVPLNDVVIVDLPTATTTSGGAALAAMLDCVVLVVEADATDARTAQRVRAQLERSQARLEGIVLNKAKHGFFD